MVRAAAPAGGDVRNRGIGRARMFFGGFLLIAAVITWATSAWLNPYSSESAAGIEGVRESVVVFVRNSAIGTLLITALAAWMLFPARRPRAPWRDRGLLAVIAILVVGCVYQLVWLQTSVVN